MNSYRRLIVGYDGSDQAEDALAFARMLAGALGATLTLVEVMPYLPLLSEISIVPPTTLAAQRDLTGERLERLARSLDVEAEAVESNSPARGLHGVAEQLKADLIVVGSSHRGRIGRVLAGSVGRSLLNGSPCAVAVAPRGYRRHPDYAPRSIGVGFDASPEAKNALDGAAALALGTGASLRAVLVVPPVNYGYGPVWAVAGPDLQRMRVEQAQEHLEAALASLPERLNAEGRVVEGSPVSALVEEAERGLDLLVLGSRGYGRVRGVLLGSVAAELIGTAPCPVVVVPRGAQLDDPSATASGVSAPAGVTPRRA